MMFSLLITMLLQVCLQIMYALSLVWVIIVVLNIIVQAR